MRLTKEDTKKLQGIAILCMFALHLFNRVDISDYYDVHLYLGKLPLLTRISYSFDICVPIYLFCSGYGLEEQYKCGRGSLKERGKRILKLLYKYWFVIALTCLVGYFLGMGDRFPGTIGQFLANAFLLVNGYVGALWFVQTYVLLVLLWDISQYVVERLDWKLVSVLSFVLCVCSWCMAYFIQPHVKQTLLAGMVNSLMLLLRSQFPFVIGMILSRETFLDEWKWSMWIRTRKILPFALLFLVILVRMLLPNMFFAPFTAFAVIFLFGIYDWPVGNRVLRFFGKHSTNMWMTHMQFYKIFCREFIFASRNVFVIFGTLIVVTLLTSYGMMGCGKVFQYLERKCVNYVRTTLCK